MYTPYEPYRKKHRIWSMWWRRRRGRRSSPVYRDRRREKHIKAPCIHQCVLPLQCDHNNGTMRRTMTSFWSILPCIINWKERSLGGDDSVPNFLSLSLSHNFPFFQHYIPHSLSPRIYYYYFASSLVANLWLLFPWFPLPGLVLPASIHPLIHTLPIIPILAFL